MNLSTINKLSTEKLFITNSPSDKELHTILLYHKMIEKESKI